MIKNRKGASQIEKEIGESKGEELDVCMLEPIVERSMDEVVF